MFSRFEKGKGEGKRGIMQNALGGQGPEERLTDYRAPTRMLMEGDDDSQEILQRR